MTTKQIDEKAWLEFPYTWPNNRGSGILKNGNRERFVSFGLPPVPRGRKKDDLKGGDRIGFKKIKITSDMVGTEIAVFASVEIKGPGDKLDQGQILWHNTVLQLGGISEIWHENKIIKEPIL